MNRFLRPSLVPSWLRWLSAGLSLALAYLLVHLSSAPSSSGLHLVQANLFLTSDWLIMKSLLRLTNRLSIGNHFNTDDNEEFEQEFAVGATVRKKFPWRPTVTRGLGYVPQPIQRINTTISVDQIVQSSFEWDSYEKAVNMERGEEQLEKEYINPCMDYMAQEIENICAQWAYQNTNNIVGQLGTDPVDFDTTSAAARVIMNNLSCPMEDRGLFLNPNVMKALKKSALLFPNPQKDVTKQYRMGYIDGEIDGFTPYESVSLYQHTAGTWTSPSITTSGQSGSSLTVTLTAGDVVNKGDKFSIANVNPVNPMTRRRVSMPGTSQAMTFTVTQGIASAVGGGSDVLQISPAIFGPGSPYQNVDALPVATAALTLFPGTNSPNGKVGTVNLALQRNAFALASVPLEIPKAAEPGTSKKRDDETGIEIAFVRMFDPVQRKMINRFDMALGNGNLYSHNNAVAILSA